SPADILEALKKGRLWLNMRQVLDHQPEAAAAINRLYDDLEAACPGFQATRRSANILVSSPGAMVYYHIDVPQNILWHVSGEKRVWAYPKRLADTPHEELEAIIAVKKEEDSAYEPAWDEHAFVVDLKPGEWITWPQNTPHRVVNQVGLNISISTEHYTPRAFKYVRAHRANRMLKDRFGLPLKSTATTGLGYASKSAAYLAGRAIQEYVTKKRDLFHYPRTFRVDPTAEHATVELNGGATPEAFLPRKPLAADLREPVAA
ncbi:MAG: cupin-like domain-containing protein, partial [Planctomycetota bacterium]